MKRMLLKFTAVLLMAAFCAGLAGFAAPVQASAAALSAAEKKVFRKILKEKSAETDPQWNYFALYDLNGDGHKDLILEGAGGPKGYTQTYVYLHIGKEYKEVYLDGGICKLSPKGIQVNSEYSSGAGAEHDMCQTVCKIDRNGNLARLLQHVKSIMFYDMQTDTVYEKGKVTDNQFYKGENKVSASEFMKLYKSYQLKKWNGYNSLTEENIKKYL